MIRYVPNKHCNGQKWEHARLVPNICSRHSNQVCTVWLYILHCIIHIFVSFYIKFLFIGMDFMIFNWAYMAHNATNSRPGNNTYMTICVANTANLRKEHQGWHVSIEHVLSSYHGMGLIYFHGKMLLICATKSFRKHIFNHIETWKWQIFLNHYCY